MRHRALTICQPFAELIARGEKRIENRSWYTRHRGPLLIHAGKSRSWLSRGAEYGLADADLDFGAIIAEADLVDCVRRADLPARLRTHIHAEGPWCWLLERVRRLDRPIPCSGAQGLWTPAMMVAATTNTTTAEQPTLWT